MTVIKFPKKKIQECTCKYVNRIITHSDSNFSYQIGKKIEGDGVEIIATIGHFDDGLIADIAAQGFMDALIFLEEQGKI